MRRKNCTLLITLLIGLVSTATAQNAACQTPNGSTGNCVNLLQCPELLSIITTAAETEQDISSANVRYLRDSNSKCGLASSQGNPVVCCPLRSNIDNLSTFNINGGRRKEPKQLSRAEDILPSNCGQDLSNRIINGNVTELDEFPWTVLLEYRTARAGKQTLCGGVLIHKRYVLTAAHCVTGSGVGPGMTLQSVRLGEWNTATNPDCIPDGDDSSICADEIVSVRVEKQIFHEDYRSESKGQPNDIALLRLSRDVKFTNYIKPICLPKSDNLSRKFRVVGWGLTELKRSSSLKLQVTVPFVEKSACQRSYNVKPPSPIQLSDSQICAGETGKDSCRGDSGGPLMQLDRDDQGNQRWVAVGVVSFGSYPCGLPDWPGIYTKIYDYMPWILSKIE